MRLLDRYILRPVVITFFSCIFVFLFLYVIIDLLSNLEDILKQHVQLSLLIHYYLSYLPIMLVQVAPFACLLSTLYTFGKLNQDNEIIAMRASGLSVLQITKNVILFGLLVSLCIFWISDSIVPQALTLNQKIKIAMEQGRNKAKEVRPEVMTNLTMYGIQNRLFHINKFYAPANIMEGITILEHDEKQNITKKVVANRGVYQNDHWVYYQCITYIFDPNGQIEQEPQFQEKQVMYIPETPRDFTNQRDQLDFMTINQLEDYIWRLSKSGAAAAMRNLKVEYYRRFTAPFTSVIIIFLGIPFALIIRKRAAGLSSMGISILVGFFYYILDAVSLALGKGGVLPPFLSASLSHAIAFIAGLYLISVLP
ncbi:MAG: LptF/LptG family permease [Candidatus Omnitrophota bacterium]